MLYLSEKSFWRSVLFIVVFYLKLCKPDRPTTPPTKTTLPIDVSTDAKGNVIHNEEVTTPVSDLKKKAADQKNRFTIKTTTKKRFFRTTPERVSFEEKCDYLAYYCLKAYDTGKVCGRTLYYGYYTFRNYCMLDYVNCRERFEVWQVVHMGACYEIRILTEYVFYPYDDDYFLDQYYLLEDFK